MSLEESGNENFTGEHDNGRVYKLRKKNFQKKLSNQLIFFGYTCIAFQYIKYGCTFWVLIYRCLLQSILTAPYPSDSQLRRITRNSSTRENNVADTASSLPYLNTNFVQFSFGESSVEMPGAFDENASNLSSPSEQDIEEAVENLKLRARKLLFHWSFTVNILFIIWDLIFPVNFMAKFQGDLLADSRFGNIPSPYVNGGGLLGGQKGDGIFIQLIGQSLPESNLKGNLGLIFTDILIFCCQYTLFILITVNFTSLKSEEQENFSEVQQEEDHINSKISNGYDGKVMVTTIDPLETIVKVMKSSPYDRRDTSIV